MTTKLYWSDSHQTRFGATVLAREERDGAQGIILDRTAFYPTGGGQPSDWGRIGSLEVHDVELLEDERIRHWVRGDGELVVGAEVECEIDWARRLEMMQQHTGQHILSQAFFQLFGAETHGFRITDHATEIDLTLEAQPDEIERAIAAAEELANRIVFEDRDIRIHEVTPDEAARLPLRKESFVTGCIRVVEIAEYDWSPCGGTHARRTGEVGLIAVKAWERAKKMTRVHFVAGVRALAEYRSASKAADAIALRLSVGRPEVDAAVAKIQEENRRLAKRVRELAEVAARVEADEIAASIGLSDGLRIAVRVFRDRDFEELKLLAHRLVEEDGVIALLATCEAGLARIVFARSAALAGRANTDMNVLVRAACERLGGRGGGKPDFAQGGGPRVDEIEDVLESIKSRLIGEA
ncbi:MAG: DHHA1 domain-containing protein [Blastocatellia bacterium]|nr:DHHA1 domain-containing protein [Blastocatellia bacterium]